MNEVIIYADPAQKKLSLTDLTVFINGKIYREEHSIRNDNKRPNIIIIDDIEQEEKDNQT